MPGMATIMIPLMLLQAPATGIGSGPKGAGAPPDMPVSVGSDAPGTPSGASRNPAALRKVTPQRAETYRTQVADRRAEAEALAANARSGQLAVGADEIRTALQADMVAWRDAFGVNGKEWDATAGAWLGPASAMSAAQWAERRASWFASREEWIAGKQKR